MEQAVLVVSGVPGVGKSTIASLIAQQLPRSAHIEAEALMRFVAGGAVRPGGQPHDEAMRQLRLRGRQVALLADSFFEAGFTPVIDDVVIGTRLAELRADSQPAAALRPPRAAARRDPRRNRGRPGKDVFEAWKHLDTVAREETPRVGLWLDTSDQTPEESAAEVLRRAWSEGRAP
jgi:hypothetical protein